MTSSRARAVRRGVLVVVEIRLSPLQFLARLVDLLAPPRKPRRARISNGPDEHRPWAQLHWVQIGADQVALTRECIATMTPRDVVQILEEEFARDQPFVIAPLGLYNHESGGAHAVVPFKITTDHAGADSTWNIETYDPILGNDSRRQSSAPVLAANRADLTPE